MDNRRKSKVIKIGKVEIGGGNPIAIQSMTNTKTASVKTTVAQIADLEKEGCEIIRVAVPDRESAEALPKIKRRIKIPLVADIHFNGDLAIAAIEAGADKIRINPGNIGTKEKVQKIIKTAKKHGVPIRIGVNAGSLEKDLWEKYGRPSPEALVESAERWISFFEENNFYDIVLSLKSSDVRDTIIAYEMIARKCDYPLHLGITEAGTSFPGIIKSAIGIGSLLNHGIGDTIRVSLTADSKEEVTSAKEILKALGLYKKERIIISCPTCGRTEIDLQKLAKDVERKTAGLKKPVKIAVMGCVVNGPGESREADYGIAAGKKHGVIYKKGEIVTTAKEKDLLGELLKVIRKDHPEIKL